MVQLFPFPSNKQALNQEAMNLMDAVKNEPQSIDISLEKESTTSKPMNISLEKEPIKVNSNLEEDAKYTLVDPLKDINDSELLTAEECRFCVSLKLNDPRCEGIPVNWTERSNKSGKSRTTLIAMKQSLIKRNIIEEIRQGRNSVYFYRLLPMEGWQRKEPPQKKISVDNLMNAVDNIIEFPINKEPVAEKEPSIWRNPEDSDSVRYWTTGQIYDDASGIEVVRQCEAEGLIPQQVVKRAIAFSKVPQLILGVIASVGEKLVKFIDKLGEEVEKQEAKPAPKKKVIPPVQKLNTQVSQGSRYGQLVNQGQSTNGQVGLEEWYTQRYKEGYFCRPWDMHLYATNNNTESLTAYRLTRDGKSAEYRSESIRALRECWDNSIIHYFWGEDIRSRRATVEDYLRWKDGKQNQ
jgi:hypothetical protein